MSYIALYRKYRPKKFFDVVGQETIVEILKNSINNQHISHAYLFTGPRGTGKTTIAKLVAKTVNCLNLNDDFSICGKCENCIDILNNSPDIIEIDAASNNGVDEIRTLRDNVKLMPAFCKYKIYIIDEVHMLSTGAFNALLKTLEEPPSHVIFILATTEPNKIPITIMSRCQRFDFESISNENICKKLTDICDVENIPLSSNVIKYISKSSDGGLRDAINLLDQVASLNKGKDTTIDDVEKVSGKLSIDVIVNIFKYILDNDYLSLLKLTDGFISEGKNLRDVVNMMLTILRDLTIIKDVKNYFDEDYLLQLKSLNFPYEKLLYVSNHLNKLLNELKYSNNESILFQIYLFNLIEICNNCYNTKEKLSINNTTDEKVKTDKYSNNIENRQDNVIKSDDNSINFYNQIKKIRINNCLALANKEILKNLLNNFDKINDYSSNLKYNNIVEILKNGKVIVASNEYLMFEFRNDLELNVFENLYTEIEKFLNLVFEKNFKIVALSSNEWIKVKEQYVLNKKKNIKYTIIDESVVKLEEEMTSGIKDNSASDIFGDNAISIK